MKITDEQSRFGMVFLGTTHCGDNLISLGKLVAHILRESMPSTADEALLESLKQNEFASEELSKPFEHD